MARNFGSLVFTPLVRALQERYGSRRQYARLQTGAGTPDRLGPDEIAFVGERDSFYIATVGASGWPYVQYRGGPESFVKVMDDQTVAFADFRGNKQYISTGNLASDDRVALIMVDYPGQSRLKVLGRAQTFEGDAGREWIERLREPDSKDVIERAYVIGLKRSIGIVLSTLRRASRKNQFGKHSPYSSANWRAWTGERKAAARNESKGD